MQINNLLDLLDHIGAQMKEPDQRIQTTKFVYKILMLLPYWSLFLVRRSKQLLHYMCHIPFCKQTADGSTNRTEPKMG